MVLSTWGKVLRDNTQNIRPSLLPWKLLLNELIGCIWQGLDCGAAGYPVWEEVVACLVLVTDSSEMEPAGDLLRQGHPWGYRWSQPRHGHWESWIGRGKAARNMAEHTKPRHPALLLTSLEGLGQAECHWAKTGKDKTKRGDDTGDVPDLNLEKGKEEDTYICLINYLHSLFAWTSD